MDIEYIEDYGTPYWLFDKIKCHHGHVVRPKGGQTTSSILASESQHSHIRRSYSSSGDVQQNHVGAKEEC